MAPPALRRSSAEEGPRPARLDHDRRLVEAARRDPRQFDALYRRYLARVYSFAYYELRDHHAAEDATERTFLLALAGLSRFREQARPADGADASTFRVWLFQIARNVIASARRSALRHPESPIDVAAGMADPLDVEAMAVSREAGGAAWAAVDRLPEERRRAVMLRFVDDLSTSEIAGVLGRSEGAVRVLIHRALRAVAADLRAGGRR